MFFSQYNDTGNKSNIYWVSTGFIKKMKDSLSSVRLVREEQIQVFPNPANRIINISFGSMPCKEAVIRLSDTSGKKVFLDTFHNSLNVTIDISGISSGVYFLVIYFDGQTVNKKISI
jgi:hypothetical protein